jgi:hypothetical protein
LIPGKNNITSQPVIYPERSFLPPLHITHIIKSLAQFVDQNGDGFLCLKLKSLRMNEAKFKEWKFVDPQIEKSCVTAHLK